ncbi:MAG: aldehyde dehydrogenase family protein [Gaiellales bacterium]
MASTQTLPSLAAGSWISAGDTTPDLNPSDLSDVVGQAVRVDRSGVERAVAAARDAQPGWAAVSPQVRADVLDRAATEIVARKDELGELLAREEGKTRAEAIGEVARAGQVLRFAAGEAVRNTGQLIDSVRPGITVEMTREPVGVVGLITPWNFPIAIPAWKAAPALAYGNAVILKPAALVPASAWALVDVLVRAGVPEGVLGLVFGPGGEVGDALVESRGVDAISFTGSVETGRGIAIACATRGARVQLEMGGKNPLVVLDDADLEIAVDCALQGAFFSTGQRCTASSRLIVTDGIHDRFVARLVERLGETQVGNALEAGVAIGPVVDERQLQQDLEYVAIGSDEGAELAFGGRLLERATKGHFLEPALFVGATNQMRIAREEIFGPVAAVIRVSDYDEALAVANDTEFGLCSGICTTSLRHASHFRRHAEAGMVMVNLPTAGVDFHVPFGGRKGSSYGPREQGSYAREFYTQVKTSYVRSA